jgi:hypothetical protein
VVVRLYGLRVWAEDGYEPVKDDLGWAEFMACSDRAIRRHSALVACAFSFCRSHEARSETTHDAAALVPAPTPREPALLIAGVSAAHELRLYLRV